VFIAATLNEKREIVHFNDRHKVAFGERDGTMSDRVLAIDKLMEGVRFDHHPSPSILLEMWQKWVFLATLAGSTCLCRASIGDIAAAPGGRELVLGILAECESIAVAAGYRLGGDYLAMSRDMLTAAGSPFTASMLRDIEAGAPIEADHIIGDLLARRESPLLRIVYTALKAYEARRNGKN
jgi:2-dehydropantoate 2-reductase